MKFNTNNAVDGREYPFEFTFPTAGLVADGCEAECAKVSGAYRISGGNAYVNGVVSFSVICPCARCNKRAQKEYRCGFSEVFGRDGDEYPYSPRGELDLTQLLTDNIVLAMPQTVTCSEDCAGLCYVCGHDLSEGECGCDRQSETEITADNPFAELEALKQNLKNRRK